MRRFLWILPLVLLFLSLFLFGTHPVYAQTSTDITRNTVWTADESPYIISSVQFISQNVTLTIEPGVTVILNMNWAGQKVLFGLLGTLVAVGTADNPITFECSGQQLVATFTEHDPQPNAYFSYCNIKNCGVFWNSYFGGAGHYVLANSNIDGGMCWSIIYPSDNVYIQNNIFTNCSTFRFHTLSNEQVSIQNNIVIKDSANLQHSPYMFVIDNPLDPNGTVVNLNNETSMAPDQTIPPPPTPHPTPTNPPTPTPTIDSQPTAIITPTPTPTPSQTPIPTPSPNQTPTPSPPPAPTPSPTQQPTLEPSPTAIANSYLEWVPYIAIIVVLVGAGATAAYFKRRKREQ